MKFVLPVFLIVFSSQAVFGGCGSATCPLHYHRPLTSGFLRIKLHHEYINQDRIFIGAARSSVGAIRSHHDEVATVNQLSVLQFQLGVSEKLSVTLDVPFIVRNHKHVHHPDGGDVLETWNFNGFGDLEIGGQYAVLLPESEFDTYVGIFVGLKFPTGLTTARNAEGEKAEVSIQPGSGSTDGTFGLVLRKVIASAPAVSGDYVSIPLDFSIAYRANGKGTDLWKFGDIVLAHIAASYRFSDRVGVLLQLNGRFQRKSDVGETGEAGENTGGAWVYVSPGLEMRLLDGLSAFGYYQVPIYQYVNGIQQTSAGNLQFGVTTDINLFSRP